MELRFEPEGGSKGCSDSGVDHGVGRLLPRTCMAGARLAWYGLAMARDADVRGFKVAPGW